MTDERVTKEQGYLKKNTIHPNEGIVGYMNIKRKKGNILTINIPINGLHLNLTAAVYPSATGNKKNIASAIKLNI